MKQLTFLYQLELQFDAPVTDHHFTLKCLPGNDDRQTVNLLMVDVLPNEFLCKSRDSFGNDYLFGKTDHEHTSFVVKVSGNINTGLKERVLGEEAYRNGKYGTQTKYTAPGTELKKFFETIQVDGLTNLEKSLAIMKQIGKIFSYQRGSTTIATTAEQAWKQGCGVCQDYAHIMISLCRMAGIRARYVTGVMVGEGESHAWVEVFDSGYWYGLDPTNQESVVEDYIKFAHGRDYEDCLINQGVFRGNVNQIQKINVSVKEERENHDNDSCQYFITGR